MVTCEFRFRVMADCFFGLIRNYLRVDDVLIRILDTRIYYQFDWGYILRDHTHREESWGIILCINFKKIFKRVAFISHLNGQQIRINHFLFRILFLSNCI